MKASSTPPSQVGLLGGLHANRGQRTYEPCEATMFMKNKHVTLKPRHSARLPSLAETISAKTGGTHKTGPPYGPWAAKRILFYTFEAGMCMKTKDHKTECPNRNRHFGLTFSIFSITEALFAPKCRFVATICYVDLVFCRFLQAPSSGAPIWRGGVAQGPDFGLAAFGSSRRGERSAGPESGPCATLLGGRADTPGPTKGRGRAGVDLKRY